jgi:RNA polymerase sigma factor (sigma-70 family)
MTSEETYLQHLPTIERIATFVAGRSHLNPDETAEFVQEVRVRLLENDYAILGKFEGRSRFSTYLNTVIQRLYQQWRVEQWGKWRPSAEAKRLGEKAIELERLLTRDGLTFDEAVKMLTTPASAPWTVAEVENLYRRLPVRTSRPMMISHDVVPDLVSVEPEAEDRIESGDRERAARLAAKTMDTVIDTFKPEDRVLLQMRFWDARNVPDIARAMRLQQKKLYKRFDQLYVVLRRGLERAGVSREDVKRLLEKGDQEIHLRAVAGGIGNARPSNNSGGKEVQPDEGASR